MRPIYLSSDNPGWTPRTEADLQAAIDQGLLAESHYMDLKREPSSGKSANKELARDLSSFAVDGGTLIEGVQENLDGSFTLCPQPLAGRPERVEQVARSIPDPPLPIYTDAIPSAANPALGYLIVHVPASPAAPHMVDHRYLGRGDKTKLSLSDPEVRRLHHLRRLAESDTLALLDAEFTRSPVPADRQQQSHLFLLAEPVAGRLEMLLPLVSGQGWGTRMQSFAATAFTADVRQTLGDLGFSPDLDHASSLARRAAGAALTSYSVTTDRTLRDDVHDEDAVELEIHEDGGIRIFMSRLSDSVRDSVRDEQELFESAAIIYVRRLLALVLTAADESGYLGNWALAVGATQLRGRSSYELRRRSFHSDAPRYNEDTYRRAVVVSHAELLATPGKVTGALLSRFMRALGTDSVFARFLTDIPTPTGQQ